MKLKQLSENLGSLPIDSQKQIADRLEDIARLAKNASNAIYSGDERSAEETITKLTHYVTKINDLVNSSAR